MTDTKPELRIVETDQTDAGLATLELISRARESLAEARTLPDIRRVMEAASVAKDAAQRAARLFNAERRAAGVVEAATAAANDAAAVRIEAQAKAGELLKQMAEEGRRATTGDRQPGRESHAATLGEMGLSRSDSYRWQQVADVPENVRRDYVEETKAAKGEVSTAGLLKHARDRAPEPARQVEAAAPGAWDSPKIRQQRELYQAMRALPTFPPNLVGDLDSEESHRRFTQAARRLQTWFRDLVAELRAVAPATSAELTALQQHEAIYDMVFELRGASASPAVVKVEQLAQAVEAQDRQELLQAVRDLNAWLVDLEGELIRQGTGDQPQELLDGASVEAEQ